MGKQSADFDLGKELRTHRKSASLSQAELAQKAQLAERTIRALEHGSGTLESLKAALKALNLSLAGRNLPGGETLGLRLVTLRRRRKISQEALARLVGVTKPTIGALEREGKGRPSTLQRVLTVLGAGAYLCPEGRTPAFYSHAGNSSVDLSWQTPPELLEALYRVLGFDNHWSRVGMWRGGLTLRFHIPLIEPCWRISRTRLSDKDSCGRSHEAAPSTLQPAQAQSLVEVGVGEP